MDQKALSKDMLLPEHEAVIKEVPNSDSNSSQENQFKNTLTACDTKNVDCENDNNTLSLHSKQSSQKVEETTEESEKLDDFFNEPEKNNGSEDPSSVTVIEKSAREAWLDKIGIRGNIVPKFPHYSVLKDRLKSYKSWTSQNQQPNVLSEAGFFYIGVEDRTACFHCGGGLREWKSTDDPWVEHAHWFPKCNFVLNVKGKEFVDQAWGSKLNITTPKEMKNAADALKDLIDVISSKKKKFQKAKISSPKCAYSKTIVPEPESFFTCRICYEEERNVVFLPCHHVVSCNKCALLLKRCVVCRASIKDMIRAIHA